MSTLMRAFDGLEQWLNVRPFHFICVLFFVVSGSLLVFLTPPLQVPDENAHLVRAYQISEGAFISPQHKDASGHVVSYHEKTPQSFLSLNKFSSPTGWEHSFSLPLIMDILSMPLEAEYSVSIDIPNTGQYSPLSYLPQALVARLCHELGMPLGLTFYLMRFSSLVLAAICMFLSLRLLEEKTLLICLLFMMPMSMYEFASVSADSSNVALSTLITAFLLHLRNKGLFLGHGQLFLLIAAAVVLGLLKQVYGVILLLYFLIPGRLLGSSRRFCLVGGVLFSVFFAVSLAWTSVAYGGSEALLGAASGINPREQLTFIVHEPLQYAGILFATISEKFAYYGKEFVGTFGWLIIPLPTPFYFLYALLLIMGGLSGKIYLSIKQRGIMLAGVLTSLFAIFFNLYLTWNPVGAPVIDGVQGRYAIPLALMLFTSFSCLKKLRYEKLIACAAGLISAMLTIWSIWNHFYRVL